MKCCPEGSSSIGGLVGSIHLEDREGGTGVSWKKKKHYHLFDDQLRLEVCAVSEEPKGDGSMYEMERHLRV